MKGTESALILRARLERVLTRIAKENGASGYELEVYAPVEFCSITHRTVQENLRKSFGGAGTQSQSEYSLISINDSAYGDLGLLQLSGVEDAKVSRQLAGEVASWIGATIGLMPELLGDICARANFASPLLLTTQLLTGSDAILCWQYRPASDGSTGSFKFQEAFGIPEDVVLDIPEGRGIIGTLTANSLVKKIDLRVETDLYHPGLVKQQNWAFAQVHALGDGQAIEGAFTLYYRREPSEPSDPNYPIAARAVLVTRQVLLMQYRTQSLRNHISEWERELADRMSRVQAGLSVLGIAHDLARRADQLELVSSILTDNLPSPRTPDGEAQIRSALTRIGVGSTKIPLFLTALAVTNENATFIKDVIDQLNTIAKAKSKNRTRSRLRDLVDKTGVILHALCKDKSKLTFDVDYDIHVRASQLDITRILLNIVGNSLNWNAKSITVRAARLEDVSHELWQRWMPNIAQDHCALVVSDNGDGMSKETADSALRPFVTARPDGTGLGLFVVDRLAQDLGGFVRLHSAVGERTNVYVVLPVLEG